MIHHLILLTEHADFRVENSHLIAGGNKIALSTLGSIQCFSQQASWSQHALETIATQCPSVMARWNAKIGKWATFSLLPRCRYVNPEATELLCHLKERSATQLASDLILTKVQNQFALLHSIDPSLPPLPKLAANSFNRILRLESKWAKTFWARYFAAASQDLFLREHRKATAPLNISLNYGYGFLYHAIEWQCIASGIEPGIGIIHATRRSRPNLVCDLVEPFRCCVELTIMRHLDEMHDKKLMAGRFAEMMEARWIYQGKQFKLRSIIRLMTESLVRLLKYHQPFHPFVLHARDACL